MIPEQCPEKRFLVVDDHTLIRSAVTSLLKMMYTNVIIDEMADGTGIIEKVTNNCYDLIIMDIEMPNSDTLSIISHLHVNCPTIHVLIYSMNTENMYALRVLKAGAKGFVSKDSPIEELKKAIELSLHGKTYLSPVTTQFLSDQAFEKSVTPFSILSTREFQIAVLLLSGKTVSEISIMLDIGNSTAGTHKGNIFKKLKVATLLELKEMSDIYQFLTVAGSVSQA